MTTHMPIVVKAHGDRWGVICDGCSVDAQDYIYPCLQLGTGSLVDYSVRGRWSPLPPQWLVDADCQP